MQLQFRIQRLRNMLAEFRRLNGFMFTREHLSMNWESADYRQPAPENGRYFSRPIRYLHFQSADGSFGESIPMPRDALDAVIDFVKGIAGTYIRNILVQERCTHPHARVIVEWEGDRQYGYYSQLYCCKCEGYVGSKESIDRYLPATQRKPDAVDYSPPLRGNPARPEKI